MVMLKAGDRAPALGVPDQSGTKVSLTSYRGRRVLVYFYPKADTPGCTEQTCLLRDIAKKVGDTAIIGVSPDSIDRQMKFATKYKVRFPLLCDVDHVVAEKYGVWQEKSLYGRQFMGIVRSAFLIGPTGRIENAWYKISPKDTPVRLLEALSS
jgi:peroxiredoxin Q/BCP